MKKSSFAKKRNKLVSALAAGIITTAGLVGTMCPAFAEEPTSFSRFPFSMNGRYQLKIVCHRA